MTTKINGRSFGFDDYLLTLPADERAEIEQGEAAFLPEWQRRLQSAENDLAESLKGLQETSGD